MGQRIVSRRNKKMKKLFKNSIYHLSMMILSFIMLYPFLWSMLSSFKTKTQLYGGNSLSLIPEPFTTENFKRLFEVLPFAKFTINSILLSTMIPLAMIIVASFTSYALARLEFKGRNLLFLLFIATMMVPGHVTLIPNYKIIVDMKLTNSYMAMLLPSVFTAANAFNIFFFRQYFLSIPKDLENAAVIDGCSRVGVFLRIIMPNAKPAIATTAILSFRSVWNNFLWPMLVINDYDKMTLTVGLKYLKEWEPNWAVLLAGATISTVPIILIYIVLQKQFMSANLGSGFGGK